jgi:N-acyl-D-amino-acid deacylase
VVYDVIIRDGTVIDGTGNVGFRAHVAIEGRRLQILRGDISSVPRTTTVDASNCVVAPGFIDAHTHSDLVVLSEPLNEAKIKQGVTTEMIGLDGLGYAPLSKRNLEMMLMYWSGVNGYPSLDYNWSSVSEYLQRYYHTTAANVVYFVPQNCLRAEVIGWGDRPATKDEIRAMQEMLRQGMAEGAIGLSSALTYAPGIYASTEELVELCRTVAECGGVYATHVRYDLGDGAYDGFREAVAIAERSGCPTHISHYTTNLATRGQSAKLLEIIDDARSRGIDVTFDAYPWDIGSTSLHTPIPSWAHEGGPYDLIERLKNGAEREKMRGKGSKLGGTVEKLVVAGVKTDANKWCEGLTVEVIAERLKKDPWDVVCDLLVEEELQASYCAFTGDMNDVKTLMMHPAHMFITDGIRVGGKPNPRAYGTYPKILGQLVRDEGVMSLEQAIRKMTSFPAQRHGLSDRGILRDGMKADIVVFDPNTVSCTATFAHPTELPIGIEYVFVNGKMVLDRGTHTGALPGEPLRMTCHSAG